MAEPPWLLSRRWLRWRMGERWSIWHRADPAPERTITINGHLVRGVLTASFNRTQCGLIPGPDVEWWWRLEMPPADRCRACTLRYLLATLPPIGSPGGLSPRRRAAIRGVSRRGRVNEPVIQLPS